MMYKVLQGKNRFELEEKVQFSINAGWKPLGGVSLSLNFPEEIPGQKISDRRVVEIIYAQAVVKSE